MSEKWKDKSIHHLVWRVNKWWANVEHPDNKIILDVVRHRWLNSLFQCLQSPYEQLEYLRDMYDSVLSDTSKELFDTLLATPIHKFYKDEIIKKRFKS